MKVLTPHFPSKMSDLAHCAMINKDTFTTIEAATILGRGHLKMEKNRKYVSGQTLGSRLG